MKKIFLFVASFFAIATFALNAQETVFTFDELSLPDTGFWNGSNTSFYNDFFGDDLISFPNTYTADWDSWEQFAFSSLTDTLSQEFSNQWSVFTGEAFSDSIFGLAYIPTDWMSADYSTIPIEINFTNPVKINGLQITNSTYTGLSIKNGSAYSLPFEEGDYFKIMIYGIFNETKTDSIEVFLADFRDGDTLIVKDWLNIDLSSLDTITSLRFDAYSTDIGDFGINTPLYFCIDDISYNILPVNTQEITDNYFNVYPNPTTDFIFFNLSSIEKPESVKIFDLSGRIVFNSSFDSKIDVSDFDSGTYIIQIQGNNIIKTSKFVKL
ncbi:MAG: DUF4465 domain-containing protein [Bacteroidales bacterium]|nr:DUF4465 domain-containing protein [Bacteroidales bacterium]